MEDLDYEPALDEKYRWETWGANEDFTGDGFLEFVNGDLLPYLRELRGTGDDDPRNVISAIFQDVNNRMLSGTLLRDLVNIVNRIDFQADDSAQLHNNIRGIEKKPLPYLPCMMNLLLHDVDKPRVVRDNALTRMRN